MTTSVTPQCDMTSDCKHAVSHIGEKGFAYCAEHASHRKGWERCRKMRKWEIDLLKQGKPLPSYKPGPKPKA